MFDKYHTFQVCFPTLPMVLINLVHPHLMKLHFSVMDDLDEVLEKILHNVPNLEELTLDPPLRTNLPLINERHLKVVGRKCPKLKLLDIGKVGSITSDGLRNLVPNSVSINDIIKYFIKYFLKSPTNLHRQVHILLTHNFTGPRQNYYDWKFI